MKQIPKWLLLNAEIKKADGSYDTSKDKAAAKAYFLEHVNNRTVFFHNLDVALGDSVLLDMSNTYTWINLPVTNDDGINYRYAVDEVEVPEGYTKTIDGFIITNTFIDPIDPEDPEDPVDPEDPIDPEDPVDSEDPVDPVDPVDPIDPIDPVEPIDPTPEPSLPVTGSASLAALYGTGFAAIFTGTLLIKKKNKK